MSSLLDILHRRDARPGDEAPPDTAAETEAAPTVELRLAIDNGPLDTAGESSPELALAPDAGNAVAQPAPYPGIDPTATLAGARVNAAPAGDATQILTASQLRGRSRQGTALLAAGLAVIVVAAGLATWLLDETSALGPEENSQFTAPGPAPGQVERPAPAAAAPAVAKADAARPAAASAPAPATEPGSKAPGQPRNSDDSDTAWFDTPALEGPAVDAAATQGEPIRIVRGTANSPLYARLTEAWAAFQAADYPRAEALYREVRSADAANVDALLGLGALAARGNRMDEAREFYQAVLLAEPRNPTAASALSMMPAAGTRGLDESTLKGLLRDQPGAANLHFALGLQYVTQGRWPDAQMAFFDAVRNEPTNADYAYNLAVSLDQLGQSEPAAAYYQRALELANASALFSKAAAEQRLSTLRSTAP